MGDKHTQAFSKQLSQSEQAEQYEREQREFNNEILFVQNLSHNQFTRVEDSVRWQKTEDKESEVIITNKEMYDYCISHKIVPAKNVYNSEEYKTKQQSMNFTAVIEYSKFKDGQDVELKGRKGWVLSNDTEMKIVTVEFEDGEIEDYEYEKK